MALLLSSPLPPKTLSFLFPSPLSNSSATSIRSTASSSKVHSPPLTSTRARYFTRGRRRSVTVCMAPDIQRITRPSPLDFPVEYETPRPGQRPDIFPRFSPMKTPLPPPMPADPPYEDDKEYDDEEEEEEPPPPPPPPPEREQEQQPEPEPEEEEPKPEV